jgi:DNA-binding CsgD family transcriptional regulator
MADILELTGLIYDAVSEASRWPVFLNEFAAANRARQAALSIGGPRWDQFLMVCRHGWTEDDVRIYRERFAACDPWVERAKNLPEAEIGFSHDLWPEEEMERSVFYREYLADRDWYYGLGAVILRTDTGISAISFLRGKDQGPCGEAERSLMQALLPHLRRAALLYGELSSLRSERAAFTGHLDRYPQPFFIADADTRVLFANRAGHDHIGRSAGLHIEMGRLRVSSAKKDAALRRAVHSIAANPSSPHCRLEIHRERRTPVTVLVMPIPNSGAIPLGVAQPAAAILILDADAAAHPDPQMLIDLFSLTSAEARVTALLVRGKNLEEVATELNVSFTTVRTHIRNVLSKTATNRQGALISLVLRTLPFERL